MVGFTSSGAGGSSYDYVQDNDPTANNNVSSGEQWFDTSNNEAKIYDGTEWSALNNSGLRGDIADLQPGTNVTKHSGNATLNSGEYYTVFNISSETKLHGGVMRADNGFPGYRLTIDGSVIDTYTASLGNNQGSKVNKIPTAYASNSMKLEIETRSGFDDQPIFWRVITS